MTIHILRLEWVWLCPQYARVGQQYFFPAFGLLLEVYKFSHKRSGCPSDFMIVHHLFKLINRCIQCLVLKTWVFRCRFTVFLTILPCIDVRSTPNTPEICNGFNLLSFFFFFIAIKKYKKIHRPKKKKNTLCFLYVMRVALWCFQVPLPQPYPFLYKWFCLVLKYIYGDRLEARVPEILQLLLLVPETATAQRKQEIASGNLNEWERGYSWTGMFKRSPNYPWHIIRKKKKSYLGRKGEDVFLKVCWK